MMQLIYKSLLVGLASCAAVSQLSAEQVLSAEQAYLRAMPPGQQVTAAFLKLVNNSDQACKVTGGSSPVAKDVQIHEHRHSDGMMKMRPLPSVTVEAGQSLIFEPGQLHLMLFGIETPLTPGNKQELTLATENCGSLKIQLEVRSLFKKGPPSHRGHVHKMHGEHKMHSDHLKQDSSQ